MSLLSTAEHTDFVKNSNDHPCQCLLQLPDRRHSARELRDIPEKTFKELVDTYLAQGSESISMPSNLLLMYQAVS